MKWIYSEGTRNPEKISPDNWNTDLFFLGRPQNHRIQLDLFYDYRTNVDQYPRWHEYLRKNQPPTLLVGAQTTRSSPRKVAVRSSAI